MSWLPVFLLRQKRECNQGVELLGPLLFSGKDDFSVQELDFFLVAQGCGLDVKREKKNRKS